MGFKIFKDGLAKSSFTDLKWDLKLIRIGNKWK
jgi:hypothetical protein